MNFNVYIYFYKTGSSRLGPIETITLKQIVNITNLSCWWQDHYTRLRGDTCLLTIKVRTYDQKQMRMNAWTWS